MNRFVLPAAAFTSLSLAAGCAYQQGNGPGPYPQQALHSPAALAEISQALTGKIPGPPQSCLSILSANDMKVVDENTILYFHGSTTYRNDPPGGCPGIGRPGNAMVTHPTSSQLCRGDIVQVVDTSSGIFAGSCVMGDFVPFTKPRIKPGA